jgi:pyridinium-3,5-biscarboxylic acid mononucleotide sulfurtransferase
MTPLERLQHILATFDRVVIAFSGGVDSSLLAFVAHQTLGDRAHAVTAVSPSLAGRERAACEALADSWGMAWSCVETFEMENAAYRMNDGDRCYHCKSALMDALEPIIDTYGASATVLLGVNLDDLTDHRPGQRAAEERGAHFPLVEAGFTKADVRASAKTLGLSTWDKPAAPCLASRIPYGTAVSVSLLSRVERAEAVLHQLGFASVRVRHFDDTARIEVPIGDIAALTTHLETITESFRTLGYHTVVIDPNGLRSGNLNAALNLIEERSARAKDFSSDL